MRQQGRPPKGSRADDLEKIGQELMEWRRVHNPPTPIPEGLWARAASLAARLGVGAVAGVLRLNRTDLKRRMEEVAPVGPAPTFVELLPPAVASIGECAMEVESPQGGRVRILMRDVPASCLASIVRELGG